MLAFAVGVPLVSGLCAKGYRLLNLFCCEAGSPVTRLALNLVCSRGYPGLPQALSTMPHSQLDFSFSLGKESCYVSQTGLELIIVFFLFVGFLFCFEAGFLLVALAVLKLAL